MNVFIAHSLYQIIGFLTDFVSDKIGCALF